MIKCTKLTFLFSLLFTLVEATLLPPDKFYNLTGVYWGAFDPPTKAHAGIISSSLNVIPLKRLVIVINNHSYKKYTYPLQTRIQMIKDIIVSNRLHNVEISWQDNRHKLDYYGLKKMIPGPICAIAGYDSYKSWVKNSNPQERLLFDIIAVIPRGDDFPLLFDKNAFILPLESIHQHRSSTILFLKAPSIPAPR